MTTFHSVCIFATLALAWQGTSTSQDQNQDTAKSQQWRFGASIQAGDAAGRNLSATSPFPIDWPEQKVKIVREEVPKDVKVAYKPVSGGWASQMIVSIANLPKGQKREAVVTIEVHRTVVHPPADTAGYVLPTAAKLKTDVRACLAPSHHIESDHAKFKTLAKELIANKPAAWQQVEALYDWAREHVKDRNSSDKGALKAIENGHGDGVEISSTFVALCRAAGVPARLVWLPRHCYAEFYLDDAQGEGRWFPCRCAGKREFGGLTEFRPILSKGDKFPAPERPKETERFVAESTAGFGGQPVVKFIREVVK